MEEIPIKADSRKSDMEGVSQRVFSPTSTNLHVFTSAFISWMTRYRLTDLGGGKGGRGGGKERERKKEKEGFTRF